MTAVIVVNHAVADTVLALLNQLGFHLYFILGQGVADVGVMSGDGVTCNVEVQVGVHNSGWDYSRSCTVPSLPNLRPHPAGGCAGHSGVTICQKQG